MKRIILYSTLLIIGLVGSQFLPALGMAIYAPLSLGLKVLTMTLLAFIMIHVGIEFELDKSQIRSYGWDYVVAATAAAFPWILCSMYFVYVLSTDGAGSFETWKEALLAGRFAAPTSAGVLFSMLVAAGLGGSWVFKKARILAIFDDLDTILLMIPLKIMIVGLQWEMGIVILIVTTLLTLAWKLLHSVNLPTRWQWIMLYSILITGTSELLMHLHHFGADVVPVQIEVLLPAFVMGCVLKHPTTDHRLSISTLRWRRNQEIHVGNIVSALFMICVGLSMPPVMTGLCNIDINVDTTNLSEMMRRSLELPFANGHVPIHFDHVQPCPGLSWKAIAGHVAIITVLSNLGKMFPAFCYRKEASWRQRLALAIGMFPRGEVGAGVIVISLSLGIGGPMIIVAILSLTLNLLLTGVFIAAVKLLLTKDGALRYPPTE